MASKLIPVLIRQLETRRRLLRLSYAALARRSGVSMPTIVRVLSGTHLQASFANVVAIAEALGMTVDVRSHIPVGEFLERQANEKAKRLVQMVQGTSGLEAQAVDDDALRQMTRQTVHELLAGSRRRLWSE